MLLEIFILWEQNFRRFCLLTRKPREEGHRTKKDSHFWSAVGSIQTPPGLRRYTSAEGKEATTRAQMPMYKHDHIHHYYDGWLPRLLERLNNRCGRERAFNPSRNRQEKQETRFFCSSHHHLPFVDCKSGIWTEFWGSFLSAGGDRSKKTMASSTSSRGGGQKKKGTPEYFLLYVDWA